MTTADERFGHPPVDILWILAHPDDEAFNGAGTMAWATDRGYRTALVCATRGEVGEIRDPALATPATLGAVREQELRDAMSRVGLAELRILGYRDSGMENTADNDNPRALIQQPPEAILTHLVGHIRDLRPRTVVTFGPEGIYGHPDHVLTGKLAARAVELADDPAWLPLMYEPWRVASLYFASAPRELMQELDAHPDKPLGDISEASRRNLGTPTRDITHWLDITPWLDVKRDALAAHRTQLDPDTMPTPADDSPFGLAWEQYTRHPLPWDPGMTADDILNRARAEIGRPAPRGTGAT